MNRLIAITGAIVLALLYLVPVVIAADATAHRDRFVVTGGTDFTLAAGQSVETLVIYDGTALIEGDAGTVIVVQGTANFVGGRADGIFAIKGNVSLDAASIVSGDVRTIDSTITGATASTVMGQVRDIGPDLLIGWRTLGAAMFLIYAAFALSALTAGVVVAGLAGRQVRSAGALIAREPVSVAVAAILGLAGLITAGVVAAATIVGIPFGVALLALVLPAMFVAGYIVSGIAIGDLILRRSSPATRERPYLAAVVGLGAVGLMSFIPAVGGMISFVGFGAVSLALWRRFRAAPATAPAAGAIGAIAEASS